MLLELRDASCHKVWQTRLLASAICCFDELGMSRYLHQLTQREQRGRRKQAALASRTGLVKHWSCDVVLLQHIAAMTLLLQLRFLRAFKEA
jgi:DNA-binding NtrC family response regulator